MKKIISITLISLLTGLTTISNGQISSLFSDSLQNIIETEAAANGYIGLSAAVIFPDGSIWQGVTGEASTGVVVDTSMNFIIGSITKNYLATLVLLLEEDGMFSIEDKIGLYLPTFQYVDENITIKQLLNHTSGLSDLEDSDAYNLAIFDDMTYQWSAEELVTNFQEPPNGPPGTPYNYSNSNYILLAALVEAVTGNALEDEFRSRIFEPLNLGNTWSGGFETPTTQMGGAWVDLDEDGTLDDVSSLPFTSFLSSDIGAGNILSKPSDMVQYVQTVYEGNLLNANTLEKMLQPAPGSEYPPIQVGYGLGTHLLDFGGHPFVGHDGQRLHQSMMYYNPLEQFGIAICINHSADLYPPFLNMGAFISLNLETVATDNLENSESSLIVSTFPNPFSSEIRFEIITQNRGDIYLEIFDQLGRKIRTIESRAEIHSSLVWDGRSDNGIESAAGIYYYHLINGQERKSGIIEKL